MSRFDVRNLCAFVLVCGLYFGAIPQLFSLQQRGVSSDGFMSFVFESILVWLLFATFYVYWRQFTSLAVHCLCVILSFPIVLINPDGIDQTDHFALAALGRCCWAGGLISFPVLLVLLALSAILGRRIEPLVNRFERGRSFRVSRE